MTGEQLKRERRDAEISGDLVCQRAGICRSRLSAIERGYASPSPDEARRIRTAIQKLSVMREKMRKLAARLGCREIV